VLTQRTPDACQKLQIIAGMLAADDLLSPCGVAKAKTTCPCLTPVPGRGPAPGSVLSLHIQRQIQQPHLGFRASLRCHSPAIATGTARKERPFPARKGVAY
jgi:hypothetical protein